jgi:hypothetical protein
MIRRGKYHILKKMNYVSDQQGIIDRYLKESESWALHLENTKKFIIESSKTRNPGNCAVLGSGWLLDVPIDFLSERFNKVYLFDILHPVQIQHKVKKYSNVMLVEQDITGGAVNELFESVQLKKIAGSRKELKNIKIEGFAYHVPFDFVVSANILNQLDILLIDYLKNYNLYTDQELFELRILIQQKHYDSLPVGKTCLITDIEELVCNSNKLVEKKNSLVHINLPDDKIISRWQWQFDHKDYYPGKDVIFNVLALEK